MGVRSESGSFPTSNIHPELEAKVDPSLLATSIQNSVGHRQAKQVEGEAMQAALLGKDAIVSAPTASVNHFLLRNFLLELLGKSSLKTPWVVVVSPLTALLPDPAKKLSRVAGVVSAVLLMEEAGLTVGDNGG